MEENEAFLIRGWIPSLVRGLLGGTVGRVSTGVPVPGENRAGDVRWSPPVVPKRTISDSGVLGALQMVSELVPGSMWLNEDVVSFVGEGVTPVPHRLWRRTKPSL